MLRNGRVCGDRPPMEMAARRVLIVRPRAPATRASAAPDDGRACAVLQVDDDPFAGMVVHELVRAILMGPEHEVSTCETMEDCLSKAGMRESGEYDMVTAPTYINPSPRRSATILFLWSPLRTDCHPLSPAVLLIAGSCCSTGSWETA